jgi:hypothetical protein
MKKKNSHLKNLQKEFYNGLDVFAMKRQNLYQVKTMILNKNLIKKKMFIDFFFLLFVIYFFENKFKNKVV